MLIAAPAKINLTFEILGRREDGYHNIRSVMQTVDLCDHLVIERADHMEITGCLVCRPEDSLILRAVRAMEAYVGRELPCSIHLDKVIPIGAGLGGGSSDAAATLLGLNRVYNLGIRLPDAMKIASSVGADVPFFLHGGMCLVEGIGDQVTPLPDDTGRVYYILLRPHKRLSSREAYEDFDRTGKSFAWMAMEKVPQLNDVFNFFKDAVVSGKGPTVWVKREYYKGAYGDEQVDLIAGGLDVFLQRHWDGDIFICKPLRGGNQLSASR